VPDRAFRSAAQDKTGNKEDLMVKRLAVAVAATTIVMGLFTGQAALASNIHFVGTPTCTLVNGGTRVECTGKIAGLGTAPTTVQISATAQCVNGGDNTPPGQAKGSTGPIAPRGGQITFDVTTNPVSCPDHMRVSFGGSVTLKVFQNGVLVFQATIPIT